MITLYVFYDQKGKKLMGQIADEVLSFKNELLDVFFSDDDLIKSFDIMDKEESFIAPISNKIITGRFPSGSKLKIDKSDFNTIQIASLKKPLDDARSENYSIFISNNRAENNKNNTVYVFQRTQYFKDEEAA